MNSVFSAFPKLVLFLFLISASPKIAFSQQYEVIEENQGTTYYPGAVSYDLGNPPYANVPSESIELNLALQETSRIGLPPNIDPFESYVQRRMVFFFCWGSPRWVGFWCMEGTFDCINEYARCRNSGGVPGKNYPVGSLFM